MFSTLREANLARQAEWDTGGNIDLSYAGNELAGEVGELIQATVDLLNGSDNFVAFEEEIGDVIICCDLIAMRLERPLETDIVFDGHVVVDNEDLKDLLIYLALEVGNVSNTIKKRERERFGMVGARGSLDDLVRNLSEIVRTVHLIGEYYGKFAGGCVASKFNLTSAKYGLATKMVLH